MIHVFHGFLGSPSDFPGLKFFPQVILHDLYQESLSEMASSIKENDTLIGYSMGGRVAMELASRCDYQIHKLVLLSAHPGLATDTEKSQRIPFEDTVSHNLNNLTPEGFIHFWNELEIFKHDEPLPAPSEEMMMKSLALFERMRLSEQKNYLPELSSHNDKVLYLAGSQDEKYSMVGKASFIPHGIKTIFMNAGHRLFQKESELIQILKDEKIL